MHLSSEELPQKSREEARQRFRDEEADFNLKIITMTYYRFK
tara:strand:- start:931 stop:1053 length:123 start_codon:yes stop_codon:yes gene_type:complete